MRHFILILIVMTLFSCSGNKHDISFYHWKSTFEPSKKEINYCKSLNVKKQYIRVFDVKWVKERERAYPFAILKNEFPDSIPFEVVPVVYITNETFQKMESHRIGWFAGDVAYKIRSVCNKAKIPTENVKEIQFDCDWSGSSQEKYFDFINKLREKMPDQGFTDSLKISATIRLHQIKYAKKTGVPPVDKGVLMFYNMGHLSDTATGNSILDINTAKKYMVNFNQYNVPIDVALPLFSWGVQFRKGKVVSLMNNLSEAQVNGNSSLKEIKPNYYRVVSAGYLNDQFVYECDEIRLEKISTEQLKEAKSLIDEHIKKKNYELIFYHLDESVISAYKAEELKEL